MSDIAYENSEILLERILGSPELLAKLTKSPSGEFLNQVNQL
jgi:hypothetical protein